jgi:hypothetical protein
MTILSPAADIQTRQTLIKGRISQQLTGLGLPVQTAVLRYSHAEGSGVLPAQLATKPEGYFAMQLAPASEMPAFDGIADVTLELDITLRDGTKLTLNRVVPRVDLAVVNRTADLLGSPANFPRVAGAPFDFSVARDPAPVRLQAQVLNAADPSNPAAGIAVTVGALPTITTDAEGRFVVAALPVVASLPISFDDGTNQTEITFHPDYSRSVNIATFSFSPDD